MDIDEYRAAHAPKGRRSPLHKWTADIARLRADGYTIDQVRDYLQANGLTVSQGGLTAFLSRQAKRKTGAGRVPEAAAPRVTETPVDPVDSSTTTGAGPARLDRFIGAHPDLDSLAKRGKRK